MANKPDRDTKPVEAEAVSASEATKLDCGIVMPISEIDGCGPSHWSDVHTIICNAATAANFRPNLVSMADDSGIIHKRIIQNLYENAMVVCDVSGKNPNVMFELGIRLAFDKPTIIIKDDKTSYSFDTSAIEHLVYPRDLRYFDIVQFQETLAKKISATYEAASQNPDYTTFLKHFGSFKVAKIESEEVSSQDYIINELTSIRRAIEVQSQPRYIQSLHHTGAIQVQVPRELSIAEQALLRDYLTPYGKVAGTAYRNKDKFFLVECSDVSKSLINQLVEQLTQFIINNRTPETKDEKDGSN